MGMTMTAPEWKTARSKMQGWKTRWRPARGRHS